MDLKQNLNFLIVKRLRVYVLYEGIEILRRNEFGESIKQKIFHILDSIIKRMRL